MPERSTRWPIPSRTLLGGLTAAEFLAEHWQRRHLFVRGAWPDFDPPLSANDLAGLACEDAATTRIVLEHGDEPWELRYGPFDESAFASLPPTHWTLLVSDVEKWLPELRCILDPFRFIPDWRIDDLMVSYAAPEGSVGPHVDQYDVFLLQAKGRRRWQISTRAVESQDRVAGTKLDILAHFETEHEWTAGPGDLLYLPPGTAHFGVALDECMTFSIGFRAPSERDLLLGLLDEMAMRSGSPARYRDPGCRPTRSPGWIGEDVIDRVEAILRTALDLDRETIWRWFGRFITEPKSELLDLLHDDPTRSLEQLRTGLALHGSIERAPVARLAVTSVTNRLLVFVNGEEFELPAELCEAAEILCNQYRYTASELGEWLEHDAFASLALDLYRDGVLYFTDG